MRTYLQDLHKFNKAIYGNKKRERMSSFVFILMVLAFSKLSVELTKSIYSGYQYVGLALLFSVVAVILGEIGYIRVVKNENMNLFSEKDNLDNLISYRLIKALVKIVLLIVISTIVAFVFYT